MKMMMSIDDVKVQRQIAELVGSNIDCDNTSRYEIDSNCVCDRVAMTSVLTDLGLVDDVNAVNAVNAGSNAWSIFKTELQGGRAAIQKIVSTPTKNLDMLQHRQQATLLVSKSEKQISRRLRSLKSVERSAIWALDPPNVKTEWPLPMIFPSWPLLSLINRNEAALDIYHLYKGIVSPLITIGSPISTILPAYWYVRKLGISFTAYLRIIWNLIYLSLRSTSYSVVKVGLLLLSVGIYLYGIIAAIDISLMLKRSRDALAKRASEINRFVAVATDLIRDVPAEVFSSFGAANACRLAKDGLKIKVKTISDLYSLWQDGEKRTALVNLLTCIWAIDVAVASSRLLAGGACIAKYSEVTRILGIRHPMICRGQSNPVSLSRSLIITGPNAAGKSTYVKAIMFNILLAQTLGIVTAVAAQMQLWDSMMSYMRIYDVVGDSSLFEAEMNRCQEVLRAAGAGGRSIVFFDEPMHSCPPTEGAAAAQAIVKALGTTPKVKVIVTTHYHTMIDLGAERPDAFVNLCMEATGPNDTNGWRFPYKIRQGGSRQCIALELLREKIGPAIIDDAIKYKNKICGGQ